MMLRRPMYLLIKPEVIVCTSSSSKVFGGNLFHLSVSFKPSGKPLEGWDWTYGFAIGRSFFFRTSNNYKIIGLWQSQKAAISLRSPPIVVLGVQVAAQE
eukprot:scaffold23474_cov125-Cylindrotheca_fusiformis.AAC.6